MTVPHRPADQAGTTATGNQTALRVTGLSKNFPGTQALDNVSLHVDRGEVLGLLGGNGSGKSTLIKVLAGVHRGERGGTITVDDKQTGADVVTPEWSAAAGLHIVHQHAAVFPALTVAENLAIGRGFPTRGRCSVDWRALHAKTADVLERFDIPARPETLVRDLGAADRTMVAIARALQDQEGAGSGVLVLDEPTASLPRAEVELLLTAVRRYARDGQAIVFVSHRLDEVVQVCDRVTVLRDGVVAGSAEGSDVTHDLLVQLIVGRPLEQVFPTMPAPKGDDAPVLTITGATGGPLRGVDLTVRPGEVLGIAGLLGSGRTEVLRAAFGAFSLKAGEVVVAGERLRPGDIAAAMRAGVAYVPEDRSEAAFPRMPLAANLSAAQVKKYWSRLHLQHRQERRDALTTIDQFKIKATSGDQQMRTLSGGNQQKAVLARWLRREPRLLLLDEPTQGVDVSARAEIYAMVRHAVAGGCAVVLVASDFEELCAISDRVVVLSGGRVTAELCAPDLDPSRLVQLSFEPVEDSA